jgi:hypothetical protein
MPLHQVPLARMLRSLGSFLFFLRLRLSIHLAAARHAPRAHHATESSRFFVGEAHHQHHRGAPDMSDENEPVKPKDGAKPVDPTNGASDQSADDKAPTNGETRPQPVRNGVRKNSQLGRKIRNYVN